jgi:hypothetical protein
VPDKPWFRFYPVDWRGDAKLKVCSLAARGLWIELIAIMHEGTPYGHLVLGGRTPTPAEISRLIGVSPRAIAKALDELSAAGVAQRTEAGVVFSRRMVRDAEKASTDRVNGSLGGNPRVKPWVNPPVNAAGGPAGAPAGNSNSNSSGVEALSGGEPERGSLAVVHPGPYELLPAQIRAGIPGLIGAWDNIAGGVPPFRPADVSANNPRVYSALRAHPSIDWWGDLFERVVASDWLAGRVPGRDGRPFVADFLWCVEHADQIAVGRYDNRPTLSGNEAVLARVMRDLA